MRGLDERSGSLFSYVDLEARVPDDRPLRGIREIVNGAFADLDGEFCVSARQLSGLSPKYTRLTTHVGPTALIQECRDLLVAIKNNNGNLRRKLLYPTLKSWPHRRIESPDMTPQRQAQSLRTTVTISGRVRPRCLSVRP